MSESDDEDATFVFENFLGTLTPATLVYGGSVTRQKEIIFKQRPQEMISVSTIEHRMYNFQKSGFVYNCEGLAAQLKTPQGLSDPMVRGRFQFAALQETRLSLISKGKKPYLSYDTALVKQMDTMNAQITEIKKSDEDLCSNELLWKKYSINWSTPRNQSKRHIRGVAVIGAIEFRNASDPGDPPIVKDNVGESIFEFTSCELSHGGLVFRIYSMYHIPQELAAKQAQFNRIVEYMQNQKALVNNKNKILVFTGDFNMKKDIYREKFDKKDFVDCLHPDWNTNRWMNQKDDKHSYSAIDYIMVHKEDVGHIIAHKPRFPTADKVHALIPFDIGAGIGFGRTHSYCRNPYCVYQCTSTAADDLITPLAKASISKK